MEGILTSSLQPLRVGTSGKIKPSLEPYTVDAQFLKHPLWPQLERARERLQVAVMDRNDLEKRIRELAGQSNTRKSTIGIRLERMEVALLAFERQVKALKAKTYAIYMRMLRDIVLSADVVS